jgi:hypothetical protein
VVQVKPKGDFLDNDDSRSKIFLGKKNGLKRPGDNFKYFMVLKISVEAYSLKNIIGIIGDL